MRPKSLITEATTPKWSKRSTLTDSIENPPDGITLGRYNLQGRVNNFSSIRTCSMSVRCIGKVHIPVWRVLVTCGVDTDGGPTRGCSNKLTGCPIVRQVIRFGTGSRVLVTA